jgi:para-aminobenzoate synthetase/4-amino-4-deoxychorismate lyase
MRAIAKCTCGDAEAYRIVSMENALGVYSPSEAPPVDLIETFLHTPLQGFFLWEAHRERLISSAIALGFADAGDGMAERLRAQLDHCAASWPAGEASRVRLLLGADGAMRVFRSPLATPVEHPPISLDTQCLAAAPLYTARLDVQPVCTVDIRLLYKSSERDVYKDAQKRVGLVGRFGALSPPECDVLMFNEACELTECSIANVALQDRDGKWRTPPLDCGLLAGTMRAALLRAAVLYEGVITLNELRDAVHAGRQLVGFNAVRGAYRLRVEENGGDVPLSRL